VMLSNLVSVKAKPNCVSAKNAGLKQQEWAKPS
jgi:hypothetical protein